MRGVCFPCRIYSPNSDSSFVRTGFNDWKHPGTEKAPEDPKPKDKDNSKLKGFLRHAVSTRHQTSMKLWEEQKKRSSSSSLSINTMVLTRIPERRRWVEAVFKAVKYLTVNGLPFRGHDGNTDFGSESFGGGDLLFKLDENLKEIAEKLPANAKYTSPYIQKEVISLLQSMLKTKITDKVNKAETFTVMMDGSSDKCWWEIEGVVVRFIDEDGKIEEHAIDVVEAHDRSAQGLLELLTTCLASLSIPLDGIVLLCYDGASVMSGHRGGLQALLSIKCGRVVLYIHCFCHKLHLVITDIITDIPAIGDHYSLVKCLYDCLKLADVKQRCTGVQSVKAPVGYKMVWSS